MLDTPIIASSAYASRVHNFASVDNGWLKGGGHEVVQPCVLSNSGILQDLNHKLLEQAQQAQEKNNMAVVVATRCLVKVIIMDPNENIPLNQCILHSGEEKLTDATDQELFFELDIKQLLDAHNDKRVKLVDKKVKERTEYLEPAKIRELKMVVVNIASF